MSKGLREDGIDTISVSFPDKLKREIDIELSNGGNLIEKSAKHLWNWARRIYWFFRFNTFHFYYGSSLFPKQWDLPLYKLFGKKVIMHYLGNDVQGYKKSVEKFKWTNMPGFIGSMNPELYDKNIEVRMTFESRFADLQLVCAPLYSEFVPNSIVIPLALDLKSYEYTIHPHNDIIIIMHSPTNRGFKGTDYIIAAINKLIREGAAIKFKLVENVTHSQLKEEYKKCDIFIDQIMAGWYGTAAIEAMALGRPVICSIRESYFEYIDYGNKIPIIHADPDCIYDSIKYLIENKEKLSEIGVASRKFIEEVHDYRKISNALIKLYSKIHLK